MTTGTAQYPMEVIRAGRCPHCGGFMARVNDREENCVAKCLNCGHLDRGPRSPHPASSPLPRHRGLWLPEEVAEMRKMREKNFTYRAIAERYGCSPDTVRELLRRGGG